MTTLYDLHSHSTFSDGTLSPEQLLTAAKKAGVDVLALTDHDCTAGISTAKAQALKLDIGFVAGVEISVSWNSATIHVLGLGIEIESLSLQAGLANIRDFRLWRAQEMGRRLEKSGIPGAFAGAEAEAGKGSLISRTHFARFLVKNGYARDFRQVFKKYLVQHKPGHVAGDWAPLEDAVTWINDAGGQAVVAHPARYKMSRSKLNQLLSDFRSVGGVGLEVVSSAHSPAECQNMAQLALSHQLLASCGSDFHSPDAPWAQLGRMPAFPKQITPIWDSWTK